MTPPPRELIQLLPMPRLHVMIDTVVAAFVGLHGGGSAAAGSAAARAPVAGRVAEALDDEAVHLTLRDVSPGSHVIEARLVFGVSATPVPEVIAEAIVDVTPFDLVLDAPENDQPGAGRAALARVSLAACELCARTSRNETRAPKGAAKSRASSWPKQLAWSDKDGAAAQPGQPGGADRRLRLAFLDVAPSVHLDGQRQLWIAQAAALRDASFDLRYVMLVSSAAPTPPANSPVRLALAHAGVRAIDVPAPWTSGLSADGSAEDVNACAAETASAGGGGGRLRTWRRFLATVDVTVTFNAGVGAQWVDYTCLGVLAASAGVTARVMELPLVPPPQHVERFADVLVAPSTYAAQHPGVVSAGLPTVVIHPGVSDEWFAAGDATRVGDSQPTAVWVGRLDPDKSPSLFIRACAIVQEQVRAFRRARASALGRAL